MSVCATWEKVEPCINFLKGTKLTSRGDMIVFLNVQSRIVSFVLVIT